MSASTKKNDSKGKATAPRKRSTVGGKATVVVQTRLEQLEKEAEALPKLIRPPYKGFAVPSDPENNEAVIIRAIPIGPRDGIMEAANESGEIDTGVFADHVILNSLVEPKLTIEQINEMQKDDYNTVYKECYDHSYREVEKVIKTFPSASDD